MPSNVLAASTAIWARLAANWDAAAIPISWPNQPFTPPIKKPWIKIDLLWGDTFLLSMEPSRGNTTAGVIQITLFVPMSTAQAAVLKNTDLLRNIFNRVEFAGVRCNSPSGPAHVDDVAWDAYAIRVNFTFDEST